MAATSDTGLDLTGIAPGTAHDEYRRRGAEEWSDRALVAAAGRVLAPPRAAPADSFVLHAPLELLARAALLGRVAPAARTHARARARIVGLAAAYEAAGDPVAPPRPIEIGSLEDGARDLVAAIGAGDLDAVDQLATAFAAVATPADLARLLGDALAPSLSAAGHAPILLFQFPRIATAADVTVEILRGAAREIARHPDWRIDWFDATDRVHGTEKPPLLDALLGTPPLGLPGNDFIFPLMHQVEATGVAASVLSAAIDGPIDIDAARRDVARVAAYSMLQEPPTYAPYGWTHCLTMPQAVIGLADRGIEPRAALAVAGTFVAGFRAGLGSVTIDPEWQPERATTSDLGQAIAAGAATAAATVWHAPDAALESITTDLATRAALHHDAHVVKYTLACIDAAADDPPARRLFLAAAAALAAWWAPQPDDGFFV